MYIEPILLKKDTIGNNSYCTHGDEINFSLSEPKPSGDKDRPYLIIETSHCKFCGATIEQHWKTAYRNYKEGVDALIMDAK